MKTFENKVVLITGAARGVGAATARILVGRGARVVLVDIDDDSITLLASEFGADRAIAATADVCNLTSMNRAVAYAVDEFGGVDLVLANAGIASYGSVGAVDPATFARVLDVNLLGVFHTVRAALSAVTERQGYMLVVSSLGAYVPMPGSAGYNASKAGVEQFANTVRLEIAHLGVDIGTAHLSWIDTPLIRDLQIDLREFRQGLDRLPRPLRTQTSTRRCAEKITDGLLRRKRRVNVPVWIGAIGWCRSIFTSSTGERSLRSLAQEFLPQIDAQSTELGRWTNARTMTQLPRNADE